MQTEVREELDDAIKKLAQGQISVKIEAVNGMGEKVDI